MVAKGKNKNVIYDDSILQMKIKKALALAPSQQKELLENIGITGMKDMEDHFKRETGRSGKWKKSQRAIREGGQTLSDKGNLRELNFQVGRKSVLIGTDTPYGAIHNFGGPTGRNHATDMPKREWAYISKQGKKDLDLTVKNFYNKYLGQKVGFKKIK